MTGNYEHAAKITGIGQSAIGRRLGRSPLDLTLDACVAALDDAGIAAGDIDGLCTSPAIGPASFTGPSVADVQDALRLRLSWFSGIADGPSMFAGLFQAALAVAAGIAHHIVVYRTLTESTAQGDAGRAKLNREAGAAPVLRRADEWFKPFHGYSAAHWVAMYAMRYRHEYGLTREQLAAIPLVCRRHASANPAAVMREPLTLDEYLRAPMISEPLCLLDCDIPCDGSTALVVSRADAAAATRAPVHIEAIGTGLDGRAYVDQWQDLTTMAMHGAARRMWERTELSPHDLDLVQAYDGFSFVALLWLEALGVCGPGEAPSFVADRGRISLGGELPLNTGGGQLSAGRLHGFGLLYEAVLQLRQEAGDRQLPRAEVAAVTGGATTLAGCMILTRSR